MSSISVDMANRSNRSRGNRSYGNEEIEVCKARLALLMLYKTRITDGECEGHFSAAKEGQLGWKQQLQDEDSGRDS